MQDALCQYHVSMLLSVFSHFKQWKYSCKQSNREKNDGDFKTDCINQFFSLDDNILLGCYFALYKQWFYHNCLVAATKRIHVYDYLRKHGCEDFVYYHQRWRKPSYFRNWYVTVKTKLKLWESNLFHFSNNILITTNEIVNVLPSKSSSVTTTVASQQKKTFSVSNYLTKSTCKVIVHCHQCGPNTSYSVSNRGTRICFVTAKIVLNLCIIFKPRSSYKHMRIWILDSQNTKWDSGCKQISLSYKIFVCIFFLQGDNIFLNRCPVYH